MFTTVFNLINHAIDLKDHSVVIFQENIADPYQDTIVAWTVLNGVDLSNQVSFNYTHYIDVGISNMWNEITCRMEAEPGNVYEVSEDLSGDIIQASGSSVGSPNETEFVNAQKYAPFDLNCIRDGKRLAIKRSVHPKERAIFEFEPSIFIGVLSQIEEGVDVMVSELRDISTKLYLGHARIFTADIVITGGGTGPDSQPFQFSLENVVK